MIFFFLMIMGVPSAISLRCLFLYGGFHLGKSRSNRGLDVTAGKLHASDWRLASSEAKEGKSNTVHVLPFACDSLGHRGSKRREDTIGKENAKERADKCRGNRLTNGGGVAADLAHRDDNAKNSRDNAKARHRVAYCLNGMGRLMRFRMGRFQVDLHHLSEVMGADGTRQNDLHRVTKETDSVVIGKKSWILADDRALFGVLDVRFQAKQALFSGNVEQLEHHLENVQVSGFGKWIRLENAQRSFNARHHAAHTIGGNQGTQSATTKNNKLGDLNQDADLAMVHHIAAQRGADYNDNANDRKHLVPNSLRKASYYPVYSTLSWQFHDP